MAAVDIHVTGLAQLKEALAQFPLKLERNVLRGGLRAGARLIEAEAERLVPVKTGRLRESIRVSTRSRRGVVSASVKAGSREAFYARWIEFGTARHFIEAKDGGSLWIGGVWRKFVHHPGARSKPYLRPALDRMAVQAVYAMADYMRARIETEVIKAGLQPEQPDD